MKIELNTGFYEDALKKAMENIQLEVGCTLAEAVEKQTPMQVVTIVNETDIKIGTIKFCKGTKVHKCGRCERLVYYDPYCRYCGQKLQYDELGKE